MKNAVKSFMFLLIMVIGSAVRADIKNVTIHIAVGSIGGYTFTADNGDFLGPKCSLIPPKLAAHYEGDCIFAAAGGGIPLLST